MDIERRLITQLVSDPANARKHGARNLDAIRSSLARFGQQKPIVIDRNNVVRAGNGTFEAAKSLGWKDIAVVVTELDGSEATAYAIADNRTAELAEWDDEILAATLQSIQHEDATLLATTGYDAADIEKVLRSGMPDAVESMSVIEYRVIVDVDSTSSQAALIDELEKRGYKCQPLMS